MGWGFLYSAFYLKPLTAIHKHEHLHPAFEARLTINPLWESSGAMQGSQLFSVILMFCFIKHAQIKISKKGRIQHHPESGLQNSLLPKQN